MFDRCPLPRKLQVQSCRTSTELIGADLHVERLIFVVIWLHNLRVFILGIKSKKFHILELTSEKFYTYLKPIVLQIKSP